MFVKSALKFIPSVFVLFLLVPGTAAKIANAESFYVGINGSDSNDGSQNSPWATFSYALSQISAGDTLILKDGLYRQSLNVNKSGSVGNPIVIQAQNDGRVTIDGGGAFIPLNISGSGYHDVVIEGIRFQNSSGNVLNIGYAQRVTLRRVTAYEAARNTNPLVCSIMKSSDILLEDCAISGYGRVLYNVYDCDRVTLRRCWGRWTDFDQVGEVIIQIYGSSDSIVENCIGTMDRSKSDGVTGMTVWANSGQVANRNVFYGNITYDLKSWGYMDASKQNRIEGNQFVNNVSINEYGFYQRGDADLLIDNMTWVGASAQTFTVQEFPFQSKSQDYAMGGNVRNSILLQGGTGFNIASSPYLTSFTHSHNSLVDLSLPYAGTTQGVGEISVNPSYDVGKYGKGAYLFVPDDSNLRTAGENGGRIGADVRYRYLDGVLTDEPLWPWPMEERIFNETGISATWDANGGLWKSLENVYPAVSVLPPPAPTGLRQLNASN